MPGSPILHYLLEITQIHIHSVGNAIWVCIITSQVLNLWKNSFHICFLCFILYWSIIDLQCYIVLYIFFFISFPITVLNKDPYAIQ